MTRDEIIKLARESGLFVPHEGIPENGAFMRFAALVVAKEREACAKVVEIFDRTFQTGGGIAGSIRARGNDA